MCDKHEFVFEFDKAYTAQLIEKFEASPQHPLTIDVAPPRKGVYALYFKGKLVYAGKALDTTLKRRLNEHGRKIYSRRNIKLADVTCRFLLIDSDWYVRAGEHALITSYKPDWNASGFGSHVPGRERRLKGGCPSSPLRVCTSITDFSPVFGDSLLSSVGD